MRNPYDSEELTPFHIELTVTSRYTVKVRARNPLEARRRAVNKYLGGNHLGMCPEPSSDITTEILWDHSGISHDEKEAP